MFGIEDRKLFMITRVLTIILSLGVIACGILRIILDASDLELISWVWTIYWIIFGLILLLGELRVKIIIEYCTFLKGNIGKGLFIIFLGSIMLINFFKWYTIVGMVLMGLGFVVMCLRYDPNAVQDSPLGS